MEKTDTLNTIFRHHLWANAVIFDFCCQLSDEQLDASMPGTYGSIRETLYHILRAERSYFSRISTGEPYKHPENDPQPTISDMAAEIRTKGEGLIEWASKVEKKDFVVIDWDGTMRDVPKTIILNQVINHATEHRTQIKSILTQIGLEPPDLSSWTYFEGSFD